MRQDVIVFGLAAILLVIETVLNLIDSGKTSSRTIWCRLSTIVGLSLGILVLWNLGFLTGAMAAVAVILLLAELCLISIRHYNNIPAKIISCVLAFSVLTSVVATMILSGTIETRWKPKPDLQIFFFEQAKTKMIAKLAAEKFAGTKALVISPERMKFLSEKETDKIIQCLKDCLSGKIEVSTIVKVPLIMEKDRSVPKLDAIEADKLIAANSNCQIIISYAGLPQNYSEMTSTREENGPVFFIMDQYWRIENEDLTKLLQEGCIASYVFMKNQWKKMWMRNPIMPSSDENAFKQRYILVTPENLSATR